MFSLTCQFCIYEDDSKEVALGAILLNKFPCHLRSKIYDKIGSADNLSASTTPRNVHRAASAKIAQNGIVHPFAFEDRISENLKNSINQQMLPKDNHPRGLWRRKGKRTKIKHVPLITPCPTLQRGKYISLTIPCTMIQRRAMMTLRKQNEFVASIQDDQQATPKTVLIMFVEVRAFNPDNLSKSTKTIVFLDSGLIRSYIATELAKSVDLPDGKKGEITMYTFSSLDPLPLPTMMHTIGI
ncbi:hypothetical protein ANCDUO_02649 [Ancylostoma duodenale]|uniref:Peptidase aspartic putative domain-containing protein n=1 Tax=Ancylostoma duodenale TaxID=51022 RepID=A0A0C2HBZ0_9BILA|nr:hypothetical protein ANCDUO_02649 [Ancylostoma duodenale]